MNKNYKLNKKLKKGARHFGGGGFFAPATDYIADTIAPVSFEKTKVNTNYGAGSMSDNYSYGPTRDTWLTTMNNNDPREQDNKKFAIWDSVQRGVQAAGLSYVTEGVSKPFTDVANKFYKSDDKDVQTVDNISQSLTNFVPSSSSVIPGSGSSVIPESGSKGLMNSYQVPMKPLDLGMQTPKELPMPELIQPDDPADYTKGLYGAEINNEDLNEYQSLINPIYKNNDRYKRPWSFSRSKRSVPSF